VRVLKQVGRRARRNVGRLTKGKIGNGRDFEKTDVSKSGEKRSGGGWGGGSGGDLRKSPSSRGNFRRRRKLKKQDRRRAWTGTLAHKKAGSVKMGLEKGGRPPPWSLLRRPPVARGEKEEKTETPRKLRDQAGAQLKERPE